MSRWRDPVMNCLVDALKLSVRACLLIDGIILSAFTVWLVYNGVIKLGRWLNEWLFVGP